MYKSLNSQLIQAIKKYDITEFDKMLEDGKPYMEVFKIGEERSS